MFNGKMKAVTFSYDDAVSQDLRLIEMFNKYGLKCTFNLNSGLLGKNVILKREGKDVEHFKIQPSEIASVYKGHEGFAVEGCKLEFVGVCEKCRQN